MQTDKDIGVLLVHKINSFGERQILVSLTNEKNFLAFFG